MADRDEGWSTPRVLGYSLLITFVVLFVGNGVCNELLGLGVPMSVFSGLAGLAMFPVVWRWRVMRRVIKR